MRKLPFLTSLHSARLGAGASGASGASGAGGEVMCCRLEQELDELDDPDMELGHTTNAVESGNGSIGMENETTGVVCGSELNADVGVVSPHIHIASGGSLDVTVTVKAW